jgi:hypothetical protein
MYVPYEGRMACNPHATLEKDPSSPGTGKVEGVGAMAVSLWKLSPSPLMASVLSVWYGRGHGLKDNKGGSLTFFREKEDLKFWT